MATYAIGDLQACLDEFQQLLTLLEFDPDKDQLWLTGDLVGRGPKPLATLRFIRSLGDAAINVLGNHDLHLLAQAEGCVPETKRDPSFQPIFEAPDGPEVLAWLRQRPLLHVDQTLGYGLIHAGLAPQWDLITAMTCAQEVQAALRGPDYADFLRNMYGNEPARWQADLSGYPRLRFITNCFTRLRYCKPDGSLCLSEKGKPGPDRAGLMPWFMVPQRQSADVDWLFGHWSTLGQVSWPTERVHGLDSGCIWGGALTALSLETGELTQLPCKGYQQPR